MSILSKFSKISLQGRNNNSDVSAEDVDLNLAHGAAPTLNGFHWSSDNANNNITVQSGTIKMIGTDQELYSMDTITKNLSATFSEGNNGGALAIGLAGLPQSGFSRLDIIKKDDSNIIDIIAGLNLSGASLPTGWSRLRSILHIYSGSDQNIHHSYGSPSWNGGQVRYTDDIQLLTLNVITTIVQANTIANVSPSGIKTKPMMTIRFGQYGNGVEQDGYISFANSSSDPLIRFSISTDNDREIDGSVIFGPVTKIGQIYVESVVEGGSNGYFVISLGWDELEYV